MLHFNLRFSRWFPLLAFFIFAFSVSSPATEAKLPIEGIVYEPKDPAQSMAVIDGNVYKAGEKYQAFEIVEVQQDRVIVKNAAGQVSEQRINGGNHAAESKATSETLPASKSLPLPDQETVPPQTASPDSSSNPLEKLKKMFTNLDPTFILNYASQIAVMADLRNLYSTAAAAAMESDGQGQISIDQLIKDGRLNPAYKENKNGYHYRIEVKGEGAQVYADPLKAGEKSRHFMIDVWGNFRVEEGRPATDKSPLLKPLAAANELAQQTSQQQGLPPEGSEQS